MFDRIVVGFDGSPTSRRAVDWAGQEAVVRHAALEVATALEEPWAGPDSVLPTAATRSIHAIAVADLAAELDRISACNPTLDVSGTTGKGSPAHVLRNLGRHADLIVIGAFGRPPAMPHELGMTARGSCPTEHCAGPGRSGPSPRPAACPRAGRARRLVTDAPVLDAAVREANLYGAELVLIHCSERDESVDEAKRVLDAASCAPQATAVGRCRARLATQPLAATSAAEADGRTLAWSVSTTLER